MKYYSELTKQLYDNEESCKKAEVALQEKEKIEKAKKEAEAANRRRAAETVEAARKAYIDAQKTYRKALGDFCDKYGAFHTSLTSKDYNDFKSIFDIFDLL